MPKQAVIFDMDGVLTDSEPFYAKAVNETLAGTPHFLTEEDHRAVMGSSIDDTWQWVMRRFNLEGDIRDWKARYNASVLRILSQRAEPTPGVHEILAAFEARGMKIGLATSSLRVWVDAILARLGLTGRFQSIASADMVQRTKPDPDLYLLAAKGLAVPPSACVAIEDSPRGIQAAKNAGILTIALRTGPTAHMDISAADHVIDRLPAFDLSWLA